MKFPFRDIAPSAVLAIAAAAVVFGQVTYVTTNFGETLRWSPGSINSCNSVEDVIEVVNNAISSGNRVKAYGTGWSWNTAIAGDGDDYVLLRGDLADVSAAEIDLDEPSVIVNAGVQVFNLFMLLQDTGFAIEAAGGCLTAAESQTIGGLLATNVHHAGIRTYYDIAEWVEIVTADGELVRTFRNETLFRLTVGGQGRTGIITRAKFNLAPSAVYDFGEVSESTGDGSFRSLFTNYAAATEGYEPNESIIVVVKLAGLASIFIPLFKVSEPENPPAVLPPNYGDLPFWAQPLYFLDAVLDRILPPFFYNYFFPILLLLLRGEAPETEGTTGVNLYVGGGASSFPHLKHQELEFFVPVDLIGEVGAYLDELFADGYFPYINANALWFLRYVYGNDSLTAYNGVMFDGTITDVIAVNIDCYHRSMWGIHNAELQEMMAALNSRFPRQIRLHSGKFNAPQDPDPESEEVKSLIEGFDPQGVFARDQYDGSYLTGGRAIISNYFWNGPIWNFVFRLIGSSLEQFIRIILPVVGPLIPGPFPLG